jgi:hypothetical protein
MPWDRSLYPKNWEELATDIKQRANWTCQKCKKECRRPGEKLGDFILRLTEGNLRDTDWSEIAEHPQRWTLTVAHLDHEPSNSAPQNLLALCAPCHCRMDLRAMPYKSRRKKERLGQLRLVVV